MKNTSIVLMAIAVSLTGCSMVTVDPGEKGVLVDKPYFIGSGGVRDESLEPGRYFTWFSTSAVYVDVKPLLFEENFDDLMTIDTVPVDFRTTLQIQVTNPQALVKTYGDKWYENNLQRQYQAMVRDEARRYSMNDLLTGQNTPATMESNIRTKIDALIKSRHLPFSVTDLSIGRALPNKNVLDQIDQTAAQQQRSKTMIEATKAEQQREKSEAARAAADNAYRQEMNLSADQFIQLESVKRYSEVCTKSGNCNLIIGGSGVSFLAKNK